MAGWRNMVAHNPNRITGTKKQQPHVILFLPAVIISIACMLCIFCKIHDQWLQRLFNMLAVAFILSR